MPDTGRKLKVFLSFAGSDRPAAVRLGRELAARHIETVIDRRDIPPGGNFVEHINDALAESDYYVLLWSAAAARHAWVQAEYTAALALELDLLKQRSFFVVMRLDDTRLPPLLAPRHCLDLSADWDGAVRQLKAGLLHDSTVEPPLYPAPNPRAEGYPSETSFIYIRNQSLAVTHVTAVPQRVTGAQLMETVRFVLRLPEKVAAFGGLTGMRFAYYMSSMEFALPADPYAAVEIRDGATIQLEVDIQWFGPDGDGPKVRFRGDKPDGPPKASGPPKADRQSLFRTHFGHLMPRG